MKVAYVFANPRSASYKLGQTILLCDMRALERNLAEGEPTLV